MLVSAKDMLEKAKKGKYAALVQLIFKGLLTQKAVLTAFLLYVAILHLLNQSDKMLWSQ